MLLAVFKGSIHKSTEGNIYGGALSKYIKKVQSTRSLPSLAQKKGVSHCYPIVAGFSKTTQVT